MASIELRVDEKVKLSLDLLWLRDHCRCDLCYDHVRSTRKVSVLDIPDDVGFKSHKVENGHLLVDCEFLFLLNDYWFTQFNGFLGNDGHRSDFDFEFLKKFQSKVKSPPTFHLWNKETFTDAVESSCRCSMADYVSDAEVRVRVLKSLHVHGAAFIDGAEPTQDCTESVVRKLFPVHKNFFGEMRTYSEDVGDTNGEFCRIYQKNVSLENIPLIKIRAFIFTNDSTLKFFSLKYFSIFSIRNNFLHDIFSYKGYFSIGIF